MYAKYKFTKYIADQISELRKKILGYSHGFFGENINSLLEALGVSFGFKYLR